MQTILQSSVMDAGHEGADEFVDMNAVAGAVGRAVGQAVDPAKVALASPATVKGAGTDPGAPQ